jgi:hypothetical protein
MIIGLQCQFGDRSNVVVDTPELLNRVESDNFLKQIIPVVALSTGWLGEPQRPLVHERVLDVEVVLIVKDGDLLVLAMWLLVLVAV